MKNDVQLHQQIVNIEAMAAALLSETSKLRAMMKTEENPKPKKSALTSAMVIKLKSNAQKARFNRRVEAA